MIEPTDDFYVASDHPKAPSPSWRVPQGPPGPLGSDLKVDRSESRAVGEVGFRWGQPLAPKRSTNGAYLYNENPATGRNA